MIKQTLAIRLPNWVGDVVMSLPALQAMQALGLELKLYGRPWIHDLLQGMNVEKHALSKGFLNARQELKSSTPASNMLLLTNSFSSALLARLLQTHPIGYSQDMREMLLTQAIQKPKYIHEVMSFWNLAQQACHYWYPELTWPKELPRQLHLPLNDALKIRASQILKNEGIEQEFWVLCPFAHGYSKSGQAKIWPNWAAFSKQLHEKTLVICPGKNEEALAEQLFPQAKILKGLSLGEYAAILSQAEYVIANDTGPMHMAAAVGSKTLGIFGVTDPLRTRPWGADFIGQASHWPTAQEVLERLG